MHLLVGVCADRGWGGVGQLFEEKRKMFFFEKKNQKTFDT
jgi:hypothetical protein